MILCIASQIKFVHKPDNWKMRTTFQFHPQFTIYASPYAGKQCHVIILPQQILFVEFSHRRLVVHVCQIDQTKCDGCLFSVDH